MGRGRFITLEGIDGAGKSTHMTWLCDHLRAQGHPVVLSREPGGTALGEKLRTLLLHQAMHLETEALLMFAARREHLAQVIEPALDRGEWVVCDRFTDASFAYQGGGRGLPADRLRVLESWVHPAIQPDLTFLFDVPPEVAAERLAATRERDRFEQEDLAFFGRVQSAYLDRAGNDPQRVVWLDGTRSIDALRHEMQQALSRVM